MATVKKKAVAPIYAVGAVWLAWSVLFSLYRVSDFIAAAVVSVIAYFVFKALCPDRVITVSDGEPVKTEAPPQKEKPSTGNPEIDALIVERDRVVSEMHRLNATITDPKISEQIEYLEKDAQKIIDHVVENPAKLPQIRQFLNYYLPTTLKLLNAYDRMDAAGVSGENIDGTKGKIETMMGTICAAFDRQLDALFGDVAVDISTDITVMEQMLSREGIGGAQMGAN